MAKNDYLRTSSLDVEGNLNFRRPLEKKRYNNWLLGDATRVDLGHTEDDGNTYSTPPSWVQSRTGVNHSHVVAPVSASGHDYQLKSINSYMSGNSAIGLETTAVPASGTEYYSKQSRFITRTYSLTASADLSGTSNGWVGEFVAVSGNMISSWDVRDAGVANYSPIYFDIDIPDYGKIQNIRVWVEIISSTNGQSWLEDLNISLRSPNVTNMASYPWVSGLASSVENLKVNSYTGSFAHSTFDSYPLLSNITWLASPWGRDMSVRTVFDDASLQRNNQHWDPLFVSGSTDHQT